MSTADDHYLEGERLLADVVSSWDEYGVTAKTDAVIIAAAQAHFTAALVGATLAAPLTVEWFAHSHTQEMALYQAAIHGREADDEVTPPQESE